MKTVVVTGAAGFAGCNLTEELVRQDYFVYGVVRPGSPHNERLRQMERVTLIETDMLSLTTVAQRISKPCDAFFHLAWMGERDNFLAQYKNIPCVLQAVEVAARLGCSRFICTGSQAEYGIQKDVTTEDTLPNPVNAYGAAKVAALYLSRQRAEQVGVDWVWGRIFSLYGPYESQGRMLPDLMRALAETGSFSMTAATQDWDYLYARDAAKALIALMEKGHAGEIYNIANGDVRPLKEFTEYVRKRYFPDASIRYGQDMRMGTALRPSVEKIYKDTGWRAATCFEDGMELYSQMLGL